MMRELLDKCNHDQLTMFCDDCLRQTRIYINSPEDIDLRWAKHLGLVVAKYAHNVKATLGIAAINAASKVAKYTSECAARYAGIGMEVERKRQVEFLTDMLEQDK